MIVSRGYGKMLVMVPILNCLGPQLRELECPLKIMKRADVRPMELERYATGGDALNVSALFLHLLVTARN